MEVGEPIDAEVLAKRRAVEVEPRRLQVGHDAERLHLGNRLRGHGACVRDAGPPPTHRKVVAVDTLVGLDHGLDRSVPRRMGRELQVVRQGQSGDLVERR